MSGGLSISPGLVPVVNLSVVGGTTVTPSATINTKGVWASLGTLNRDCTAFMLGLSYANQGGTDSATSIDIGIGASGSQVVLISNIALSVATGGIFSLTQMQLMIPIALATGAQIWARCAANKASSTAFYRAWFTAYDGNFTGQAGYAGVETIGNTATGAGTAVTGGSNVKGSYVNVGSPTTKDWVGFFATYDMAANAANESQMDWDIAIGASNKIIVPDYFMYQAGVETASQQDFFPLPIPAGTQFSARAACVASANTGGITIHGIF